MIPYYSPNLDLISIIRAFSYRNAERQVVRYFQELTGKKYILITNSCRTALYLAYKAIANPGEIITCPLTCKTAIDPITESGYRPVYCDIRLEDLTMAPDDSAARITGNTRAIQVIHFGGVSCEMNIICKIAKEHNLYLIEDCAQALGAKYKNVSCGSFGDVACFSLIKNGYGIGGGIFATANRALYERAVDLNAQLPKNGMSLLLFRLFRNYLESGRKYPVINFLYNFLMQRRAGSKSYTETKTVKAQLAMASKLEIKLFASQLERIDLLHKKREAAGFKLYQVMQDNGLMLNKINHENSCSFTKFIAYHPNFIPFHIQQLDRYGVEAKHLEHKYKSFYQEKLVSESQTLVDDHLKNYHHVHDHLLSLPLCEYFGDKEINFIVHCLKKLINEQ